MLFESKVIVVNLSQLLKQFEPIDEREQPDDVTVEIFFNELLDDLSISESKRKKVELQTPKEKWEIYLKQRDIDARTTHPAYAVKHLLKTQSIDFLKKVESYLKIGRNTWISLFFDEGGIPVLLTIISQTSSTHSSFSVMPEKAYQIMVAALTDLRYCANNPQGILKFKQHIDAIPVLINSMIRMHPDTFALNFSILLAYLFVNEYDNENDDDDDESDVALECAKHILDLMNPKWSEILEILNEQFNIDFLKSLITFDTIIAIFSAVFLSLIENG